jgi:hypothetical protein
VAEEKAGLWEALKAVHVKHALHFRIRQTPVSGNRFRHVLQRVTVALALDGLRIL